MAGLKDAAISTPLCSPLCAAHTQALHSLATSKRKTHFTGFDTDYAIVEICQAILTTSYSGNFTIGDAMVAAGAGISDWTLSCALIAIQKELKNTECI